MKKIILGVTGGIAAYKCCEIVRLLKKSNYDVQVIMTENSKKFITPFSLEILSNNKVQSNQWESYSNLYGGISHINFSKNSSCILIAPASANFISKLANGISDDLLSSSCLARKIPLIIAPSMNTNMWENAATKRNIKQLIDDGINIIGPNSGLQACGDNGIGRMVEPTEILEYIKSFFLKKNNPPLDKLNILITAGPTYEAIDPVRGITNKSSGKMGFSIAEEAFRNGANVDIICGPTLEECCSAINRINVTSGKEMFENVVNICKTKKIDIFFSVAAIADWRPKQVKKVKLKKGKDNIADIKWIENPDVVSSVTKLPRNLRPFTVAFAAETNNLGNLLNELREKISKKKANLLIANKVPESFGDRETQIMILEEKNKYEIFNGSKDFLAKKIISKSIKSMENENKNFK